VNDLSFSRARFISDGTRPTDAAADADP